MTAVARVVRADVRTFDCAYAAYVREPLRLGQMVAAREGPFAVLGVVAGSESGPEDPSRPLRPRGAPGVTAAEVMADNPELALLIRTQLTVVACGHVEGETMRATPPPAPPPLLAEVYAATDDEIVRIADDGAFLAPLIAARAADDAVIAAALRHAASAFGGGAHAFTVRAGKELARLLKAEPSRLTSILRAVEG